MAQEISVSTGKSEISRAGKSDPKGSSKNIKNWGVGASESSVYVHSKSADVGLGGWGQSCDSIIGT